MLPQTWKMVSLKRTRTLYTYLCTYDGLHLAQKNVSREVYFQFQKKIASHSANQLTSYP